MKGKKSGITVLLAISCMYKNVYSVVACASKTRGGINWNECMRSVKMWCSK